MTSGKLTKRNSNIRKSIIRSERTIIASNRIVPLSCEIVAVVLNIRDNGQNLVNLCSTKIESVIVVITVTQTQQIIIRSKVGVLGRPIPVSINPCHAKQWKSRI